MVIVRPNWMTDLVKIRIHKANSKFSRKYMYYDYVDSLIYFSNTLRHGMKLLGGCSKICELNLRSYPAPRQITSLSKNH